MRANSSKLSNISIGMGGALIITIFVALCLTVFSVLSFTTAYSDLKLAKKTEEFAYDYYSIHGQAEEKLAEISDVLISLNEKMNYKNSSEEFMKNAAETITKIDGVSVIRFSDDSFTLYYESLGNKNQKLCSTLEIMYNEEKSIPYYDIVTWNIEPIELPEYEEENYDLWEGLE